MAGGESNESASPKEGLHASDVPPPPVTPPVRPPEPPRRQIVDEKASEKEAREASSGTIEDKEEDAAPTDGSNEKVLGLLCHLLALIGCIPIFALIGNILGPLVLWVLRRKGSKLVEVEGRKSVNFQILFSAAVVVLWLPVVMFGGFPLLGGLVKVLCVITIVVGVIANVVFVILGTLAVNGGQPSKYPLAFDILGLIEAKLGKSSEGD